MVACTIVTPPTLEPLSVSEAKAQCRGDTDAEDGLIAGYIIAARTHLEKETRRAFMTQTWDMSFDYGWPAVKDHGTLRHRIVLAKPPLISVTSVKYNDTSGVEQTLAADQYRARKADTGEWYIEPAYGVSWPTVRSEIGTIVVRCVCGYGPAPGDLEESLRLAMLLLIAHWDANREAVVIGSSVAEMPLAVKDLVALYRVFP